MQGSEAWGADDAWYGTALLIEEVEARGHSLTGGAADVYKCSD